jgi:hypothetical protein
MNHCPFPTVALEFIESGEKIKIYQFMDGDVGMTRSRTFEYVGVELE